MLADIDIRVLNLTLVNKGKISIQSFCNEKLAKKILEEICRVSLTTLRR